MTRVWIGVAMAWAMSVSSVTASGVAPQISVARDGQGATVILRADELMVTETLTRTTLDLRITYGEDALRFWGDLDGQVSVERDQHRRSFSIRSATAADRAALNAMFMNSPALTAFDQLLHSEWARRTPEAKLFLSARELIRVVQGDEGTVAAVASLGSSSSTSITFARQRLSPSQCWDTYARDVTKFTYDLQSCLGQVQANWWNPLHVAWCSYEYNLKSSLAAVWLLDCYGVPA